MCGRTVERFQIGKHAGHNHQIVMLSKQAGPANRREGQGAEPFWIVVKTMSCISIGPSPVKDILAIGMPFSIQRHGSH